MGISPVHWLNPPGVGLLGNYVTTPPTLTNGQFFKGPRYDQSGAIITNPGVSSSAPGQTVVTVTTTTGQILASNSNRAALWFFNNDPTNPVYLLFGTNSATANPPCIKIPAGTGWPTNGPLTGWVPNTAVQAISTGGSVQLTVLEG